MTRKSMVGKLLTISLILGASVISGAQTRPTKRTSFPQGGSEEYWLVVDEFANRAVQFAYAKRFAQLHELSFTDRQCEQYSRIAADYEHDLSTVRRTEPSTETGFWNDVRAHSINMIGAPGVPIPVRRTSKYWMTTGSDAEDRELRRLVSLEIDEASSQMIQNGGLAPKGLAPECPATPEGPIVNARP